LKEKLQNRLERIINKYRNNPEKLRKGLRLFTRITNLSEKELNNYIMKQRYLKQEKLNVDKYAGLAQSVLYTMIKNKTYFWSEAYKAVGPFDLPYGGAFITVDQPKELYKVVFIGNYAGYGIKSISDRTLVNAKFIGKYAGAFLDIKEDFSCYDAKFKGEYAGAFSNFEGKNSAWNSRFIGKRAGAYSKFKNGSGLGAKFEGEEAGLGITLENESGNFAEFKGKYAGSEVIVKELSGINSTFEGENAGMGLTVFEKESIDFIKIKDKNVKDRFIQILKYQK
jgi:hypothetical protein